MLGPAAGAATLLAVLLFFTSTDAKLITGLAPCPSGAPPARECLVSVLVDLRAIRARARERVNATRPYEQRVAVEPVTKDVSQQPSLDQAPVDLEQRRVLEGQQQQRKQAQLEMAVRFQEDELQQLREQVQELRLQLARALQLYQYQGPLQQQVEQQVEQQVQQVQPTAYYQLPAVPRPTPDLRAGYTGYGPAHEGAARRFYRTLRPERPQQPVFGQRIRPGDLRELARGDPVVAT